MNGTSGRRIRTSRVTTSRGRHSLRVCALAVGLLAVTAVSAAPGGPQMAFEAPAVPALDSVDQLDQGIESLRRTIWDFHSAAEAESVRDRRGRTPGRDIDEWLLPQVVAEQLATLRKQAQVAAEQHDPVAARGALHTAAVLLQRELYKMMILGSYWMWQPALAVHAERVQALADALPENERGDFRTPLDLAADRVRTELEAALAVDVPARQQAAAEQLAASLTKLLKAYNDARGRMAADASERDHAAGKAPTQRTRSTPCPEAASRTTGQEKPGIAAGNTAPESFYPVEPKHQWFEGAVVVNATISPTGCPQKAEVQSSSGVAELDAAALDWALQAKFVPAERDGKAIESSMLFRVKFQMNQ